MTQYTGGGGGQPTYLKLDGNSSIMLFAWRDSSNIFYTTSKTPSIYEPLYNNQGSLLSNYQLSGIKGNDIIVKKISDNTTTQCSYDTTGLIKNITITNKAFYQNGGGGSGADGEDWAVGQNQRRRKGGAGGGYYWLNPDNLAINSINGRDAGTNENGIAPQIFPNVHSGKGGASGTGSGSTVVNPKTNYKQGSGASGSSSAINPNDNLTDSYFGSGGGGAGGNEDASGGKAGTGNSSYSANTTGENAYNYHTSPTQPPKLKIKTAKSTVVKDLTNLGKGGVRYENTSSNVSGKNGWIYIYKFEKEYQTFDLGKLYGESERVTRIIDGRIINESITETINAGDITDANISEIINGDQVLYVEQWKNCGNISDNNIEETIKLGGI